MNDMAHEDIVQQCSEAWDNMRVPGDRFWHELPTDMQALAMQCFKRGTSLRASPVLSPVQGVTVKPLEWRGHTHGWRASSIFGHYDVQANRGLPQPFEVLAPTGYLRMASSEDDGKAAAQSDYEQRIRSALTDEAVTDHIAAGKMVPVEPVTVDEGMVERAARAAYFEFVDSRGYPNGLPTWDELPLAYPDGPGPGLYHPDGQRAWKDRARAALNAALSITTAREAVRVKPLEWAGDMANTIVGVYRLETFATGVVWSIDGIRGNHLRPCGSAVEAKAAAQADYEARILSALTSMPTPSKGETDNGWRDIETDPPQKDGTEILVYARVEPDGLEVQQVAHWEGDEAEEFPWQVSDGSAYNRAMFTHWRPLPTPPSAINVPGKVGERG